MDFEPLDMPACSRSPFGKFDSEMERLPIHGHIKEALRTRAAALGMTLSEYHRTVLEAHVLGVEALADLHAQRIRVIAGVHGGVGGGEVAPQKQEQAAGAKPRQLAAA